MTKSSLRQHTHTHTPYLSLSGDARLAEFMALMAPRSKAKIWANDDMLPSGVASAKEVHAVKAADASRAASGGASGIENESDMEEDYQVGGALLPALLWGGNRGPAVKLCTYERHSSGGNGGHVGVAMHEQIINHSSRGYGGHVSLAME